MRQLGGAEKAGDPERLFDGLQGLVVGREVGLRERHLQIARAVGEVGVLLALKRKNERPLATRVSIKQPLGLACVTCGKGRG